MLDGRDLAGATGEAAAKLQRLSANLAAPARTRGRATLQAWARAASLGDISASSLLAAFLKLNIDDPLNDPEALAELWESLDSGLRDYMKAMADCDGGNAEACIEATTILVQLAIDEFVKSLVSEYAEKQYACEHGLDATPCVEATTLLAQIAAENGAVAAALKDEG